MKIKVFLFSLVLILTGVILPKLLIHDSVDQSFAKDYRRDAFIDYVDKPLVRLLVIDSRVEKNTNGDVLVKLFTFYGVKICTVFFSSNYSSRAEWIYFFSDET